MILGLTVGPLPRGSESGRITWYGLGFAGLAHRCDDLPKPGDACCRQGAGIAGGGMRAGAPPLSGSSRLGRLPASGLPDRPGANVRKPCRAAYRPLALAGEMGEDPQRALDRAMQRRRS